MGPPFFSLEHMMSKNQLNFYIDHTGMMVDCRHAQLANDTVQLSFLSGTSEPMIRVAATMLIVECAKRLAADRKVPMLAMTDLRLQTNFLGYVNQPLLKHLLPNCHIAESLDKDAELNLGAPANPEDSLFYNVLPYPSINSTFNQMAAVRAGIETHVIPSLTHRNEGRQEATERELGIGPDCWSYYHWAVMFANGEFCYEKGQKKLYVCTNDNAGANMVIPKHGRDTDYLGSMEFGHTLKEFIPELEIVSFSAYVNFTSACRLVTNFAEGYLIHFFNESEHLRAMRVALETRSAPIHNSKTLKVYPMRATCLPLVPGLTYNLLEVLAQRLLAGLNRFGTHLENAANPHLAEGVLYLPENLALRRKLELRTVSDLLTLLYGNNMGTVDQQLVEVGPYLLYPDDHQVEHDHELILSARTDLLDVLPGFDYLKLADGREHTGTTELVAPGLSSFYEVFKVSNRVKADDFNWVDGQTEPTYEWLDYDSRFLPTVTPFTHHQLAPWRYAQRDPM